MDDLTARLCAEKPKRPSADELAAHNETLRRISEDLELFLAEPTGDRACASGGFGRGAQVTACSGSSTPYQAYDVSNALTRPCRQA